MKINIRLIVWLIPVLCLICEFNLINAQTDSTDYVMVTGIVRSKKSNKVHAGVNISIPRTSIGTITNEDGIFSLKIRKNPFNQIFSS